MEKNDFNVTESLPTILLDSATVHLSISADFTCPVGKVVRGSECVACAPGNAFDTDMKNCRPCRLGTFKDQVVQTQCMICPVIAGRPGTISFRALDRLPIARNAARLGNSTAKRRHFVFHRVGFLLSPTAVFFRLSIYGPFSIQ